MDEQETHASAAPPRGSSSNVKVEFHDPSGVIGLISPELQARLPLRHLTWSSQARPTRSIGSLFIDLVPDANSAGHSRNTSRQSHESSKESEAVGTPKRERRHQIPGLRSTPYLKVYLLKCDDVDTYKSTAKKAIKEWVKSMNVGLQGHTAKDQSGQEKHDAYEYMIVHLVTPNATAPWPNKVTNNILDKLKSDFNASSKTAIDRVAQIPCTSQSKEPEVTSPPGAGFSAPDLHRVWEDFVEKLKFLILSSFDARVRQYEEDIKEKGSQRNIPGWNFCTFFVLKEGLARGFESVGLLEDALMGYDELSVELSSAMRDQAQKEASGESTTLFERFSSDLFQWFEKAISSNGKTDDESLLSLSILNTDQRPYRELIMANNVSVYDFRRYVFSRQASLLLRIASLSDSSTTQKRLSGHEPHAELCARANSFIASTGRSLRSDLMTALSQKKLKKSLDKRAVVDDLVSAWTFAAANEILSHTISESLETEMSQLGKEVTSPPATSGAARPPSSPMREDGISGLDEAGAAMTADRLQIILNSISALRDPRSPGPKAPRTKNIPLQQLASQRAELLILSQRSLEAMGNRRGWDSGCSLKLRGSAMEDVSLESDSRSKKKSDALKILPISCLVKLCKALGHALKNDESFRSDLEDLSRNALELSHFAEDDHLSRYILVQIASMRFEANDWKAVITILRHLANTFSEKGWIDLEIFVLDMYSQCLKMSGHERDFVQIAMRLVSKVVMSHSTSGTEDKTSSSFKLSPFMEFDGCLTSAIESSKRFNEPFYVQLTYYFSKFEIQPNIVHEDGNDGFALDALVEHSMPDILHANEIKIQLLADKYGQAREITLVSRGKITLKRGVTKIRVYSKVVVPGSFHVSKITIKSEGILFVYDAAPLRGNLSLSESETLLNFERILVWAPHDAPELRVSVNPSIYLDRDRSLVFVITSGSRPIKGGKLHVKANTAGLRIHTGEAIFLTGGGNPVANERGTIEIEAIDAKTSVEVSVPYHFDADLSHIVLKTEFTFNREDGEYQYADSHEVSVLLPVGVNVQDVFQNAKMFSKFSVSTATEMPVRLISCKIDGNADFEASTSRQDVSGLCVFAKQPVSIICQISGRESEKQKSELDRRLRLEISYCCLDEEILAAVSECLISSLRESPHQDLWRPLSLHLKKVLLEKLPGQDLECVGLLQEIGVAPFAAFNWDSVLRFFSKPEAASVGEWLQKWHEEHATLRLPELPLGSEAPLRRIVIPVDIPDLHFVHSVRIDVDWPSGEGAADSTSKFLIVGEAIPAKVWLKYTRAWSQEETTGKASFVYDIESSPDTWLIGGKRRGTFEAEEGQAVEFPLVLIPQRPGKLLLPSVEVRVAEPDDQAENAGGRAPSPQSSSCEVDFLSQSKTILVMPGVESTTTGIDAEARSTWFVESRGCSIPTGGQVAA